MNKKITSMKFLSKSKGKIISLKVLAAICFLSSGVTLTHYLSVKDFIDNQQETNLHIKSLSENVISGMLLIKQGETSNIENLFNNTAKLNKSVDALYKKNDSLTSLIFGDGDYIQNNKDNIDRIKSKTDALSENVSGIKDNADLFTNYITTKDNLRKNLVITNSRIIELANNKNITPEVKELLTRIYNKINRMTVFDQGDLLTNKNEVIDAQNKWLNSFSDDMKDFNSFSNSVIGSKLSGPTTELLKSINDIFVLSNNIYKIAQANIQYNNTENLSKLANAINADFESLSSKNKKISESSVVWLYSSIALMLLFAILMLIELFKNGNDERRTGSKNSKSHQQTKKSLKKLDDDLNSLIQEKDKSISRDTYNRIFNKPKTTGDTTTFNIRNKIDKILNVLFSIADKSLEKADDFQKINNDINEKTEKTKNFLNTHKENFVKLENDTSKLLLSLSKMETGANKSVNQIEQMKKRIEELDPLIQNIKLKMNSIRKSSQDTSKKIKRMSESSQSIGEITDSLRETAGKLEVLALDIAIDSSSATTEHRKFSVISKEIQRLVETARMDARKIDDVITIIKEDSTNSLSSMESNTTEVVECDDSIEITAKLLKRIMDDVSIIHHEIDEMDNLSSIGNKREASDMRNLVANVKQCMQECIFYVEEMQLYSQNQLFEEIDNLRNETKRKINDGDFHEDD